MNINSLGLKFFLLSAITLQSFNSCKKNNMPNGTQIKSITSDEPKLKTTTIVDGKEIIWGMDFLPNGDLLFNERKGNFSCISF